jgi:hypothetical protein
MKLTKEEKALIRLALYELQDNELVKEPHRLSDDAFQAIEDLLERLKFKNNK